jgi:type III secretion system (T3SS) SseB-like protein
MAFLPENALEVALMRAPSDPASRPEFYRLLLESNLYVIGPPGPKATEERETVLETATTLVIASVPYKDRMYHPVFTSLARLETFAREEVTYYGINGRALFEAAANAYFLVNPGSDYGKELVPEEIARLINPAAQLNTQTMTFQDETEVLLGEPAIYPHALVDALKAVFSNRSDVLSAHLLQIAIKGRDEPPHPLIGVEATGEWQPLFQEIARVASLVDPTGIVDAVPINEGNRGETPVSALLRAPAFYRRSSTN